MSFNFHRLATLLHDCIFCLLCVFYTRFDQVCAVMSFSNLIFSSSFSRQTNLTSRSEPGSRSRGLPMLAINWKRIGRKCWKRLDLFGELLTKRMEKNGKKCTLSASTLLRLTLMTVWSTRKHVDIHSNHVVPFLILQVPETQRFQGIEWIVRTINSVFSRRE